MKTYSMDLRERVLEDTDAGMSVPEVARKYRVSMAWVWRLRQRRNETGEIGRKAQRRGVIPASVKFAEQIREAVRQAPDATLDECRARFGLPISRATLARALIVLGLTRKKSRCEPVSRTVPT